MAMVEHPGPEDKAQISKALQIAMGIQAKNMAAQKQNPVLATTLGRNPSLG